MNYLLFIEPTADWLQWADEGAVLLLVVVILGFILKALPTWKEVKLAEIKVRDKESEALGQLSGSLGQLGIVINEIAVEQRKSTDNLLILQRVNAKESSHLSESVNILSGRLDKLENVLMGQGQNYDGESQTVTAN